MGKPTLHQQVVEITQEYLGPAANRFVDRIINSHLDKEPVALDDKDLPKLSEWLKVSLALLTDDRSLVDDCEKRIRRLAR